LDCSKGLLSDYSFALFERNEKIILWITIGDPDSGEYVLFEKI
jgi:hypothetical protein